MKNLSILFLSFLFVFSSCSSDDDANDQIDSAIDVTGSWELTGMESEGEATGEFNGQTVTLPFELLGKDFDAQVVFTENPNEMIPSGTLTLEVTVIFMGFSETTDEIVDFDNEFAPASSWSIDGNILTYESEGEIQTAEITTLTQNKMVLLVDQTRSMMGLEADVIAEITLER